MDVDAVTIPEEFMEVTVTIKHTKLGEGDKLAEETFTTMRSEPATKVLSYQGHRMCEDAVLEVNKSLLAYESREIA